MPDSIEEIRVFQACDSGWRCDIKCRALAHTRKCGFFPLVSIPCFCDQRERNLTGDVLPSASRQCSVRLQQSAHVFAFSLLSSSTVPVCWSCADSSTHLRWLKTSSWWKKTRCSFILFFLFFFCFASTKYKAKKSGKIKKQKIKNPKKNHTQKRGGRNL